MPQGAKTLTYAAVFLDFSNALKINCKKRITLCISIYCTVTVQNFEKIVFLHQTARFCVPIFVFLHISQYFSAFFYRSYTKKRKITKNAHQNAHQNAASECVFWHIDIEPKCILTFARASDIIIMYNYTPRGRGGALCIETLIKYERT